jgi:hypothetical protein
MVKTKRRAKREKWGDPTAQKKRAPLTTMNLGTAPATMKTI